MKERPCVLPIFIILLFIAGVFFYCYLYQPAEKAAESHRRIELPPDVRVGIVDGVDLVSVTSEGNFYIRFDRKMIDASPDEVWRFSILEGHPAELLYIPIVETMDVFNPERIKAEMTRWREEGYNPRQLEAGLEFVRDGKVLFDNRVVWIGLDEMETREEAEAYCQSLYHRGIKAFVHEVKRVDSRGKIRVMGPLGEEYEAEPPVIIRGEIGVKVLNVPFGIGFPWEGQEDRIYRGELQVVVGKSGRVCVVNLLTSEDYLKGIVPSEIESTSPPEALKAQAVSARGEILAKLGKRHISDPYDFCAEQHCQVYSGVLKETIETSTAVNQTRGQVLMAERKILDTVYCGVCGGHTESNENVWASPPDIHLRGVPDFDTKSSKFSSPIPEHQLRDWLESSPQVYCNNPLVSRQDRFRWTVSYSAEEMNRVVNKHEDVGRIKDIILLERGVSGRLKSVRIVGEKAETVIYKELPIRKTFGGLNSAMFLLDIERDEEGDPVKFVFTGGGWGHGVGMCQAGAKGMALQGSSYQEILFHYYSACSISTLYE